MADIKLIDSFTRELVSYSTTTVNAQGQPITDGDVDNVIIRKKGSTYYRRNYTGPVNVKWFGAKGDGITDDTAVINAATKYHNIIIPKGDYLIDPVDPNAPTSFFSGGVALQSNTTLTFEKDAKFIMVPTNVDNYVFINIIGKENVNVYNATLIGDVDTHTGTTGENAFGFYINNSKNVNLYDCIADKMWGDGYIWTAAGVNAWPVGGGMFNCNADSNRRQGVSVGSWIGGIIDGGNFTNTGTIKSTPPAYGIDIEPDPKGYDKIDMVIKNVNTSGNFGGGLQLVPNMALNIYTERYFNVVVDSLSSDNDGKSGALRLVMPTVTAETINPTNTVNGKINISNTRITNAQQRAVDFARWIVTAPDVTLSKTYIENPNTMGWTATTEGQCGIVVYCDATNNPLQTTTGKITIDEAKIIDTRLTPLMLVAIWCNASTLGSIDNILIKNIIASGQSSIANGPIIISKSQNALVKWDALPQKLFTSGATLLSGQFAGQELVASVSLSLVLPPANTSIGLEYIFNNKNAVTFQGNPAVGDSVIGYSLATGSGFVLRAKGDYIKLRSIGSNSWIVVEAKGTVSPLGLQGAKKIYYNNVLPTTGTFNEGDKILNTTPSTTQIEGWLRITTGSGNVLGTDWKVIPTIQKSAALTTPTPVASVAAPTKAEFDAVVARLNELTTKLQAAGIQS